MKKLLVVSHTYVTPMNQRKVQALARQGFEVSLLTPEVVKDTLREIHLSIIDGAKFKTYPVRSYLGFHNSLRIYNPSDVREVLESVRPDYVLVEQEPYSLSTYQVMKLKRKIGFKTMLFTFQNIFKKYPLPFAKIEARNLALSDVLIVGNDDALTVWKDKGMPTSKMLVLPQVGVDFDEFFETDKLAAKKEFGLSGFTIGYAGRFVEEKGLTVLVNAFSKLSDLPITLILAGKGPEKDALNEQIKNLNLERKVRFVEGLKHEQMSKFMNALDLFILPSLARKHWREQFGHVLIEAMACGVPCIGTKTDPIDVVIGNGGLTFEMGNSEDLAQKIRHAYNSTDELKQLSKNAVTRVQQNYTNDVIAKRIRELTESL